MVDQPESSSWESELSDRSEEPPDEFDGIEALDSVSVVSGRAASTADSGVSMKSHEIPLHFKHQAQKQSPRFAEAGDVSCDLCEGSKLRAYKSCMTCLTSFCETHVRDHYTIPALQRHLLVEVTNNLDILMENALLRKQIMWVQKENKVLRKKNLILKESLRFLEIIWTVRTPVAADLKLDADTAHCALVLSDDGKGVRHGDKKTVDPSTKRFDKRECVLATEGFSSGRHYWEVEVNREFTIGVTRGSAQRKARFDFSPPGGYWCLYHYRQSFTALDKPIRRLQVGMVPQVLGVCIDVDEKWVSFYNAETKTCIYTFGHMDFPVGEKIYPVFSTLSKSVDLKIKTEKNEETFIIQSKHLDQSVDSVYSIP